MKFTHRTIGPKKEKVRNGFVPDAKKARPRPLSIGAEKRRKLKAGKGLVDAPIEGAFTLADLISRATSDPTA